MANHRKTLLFLYQSVLTIALAYGTTVPPTLTIAPDHVDFGNQAVGSSGSPTKITLTNASTVAIGIRDITASGIDFNETNDCPHSLDPGKACIVTITFTPATTGPRLGTLSISDSTGIPRFVTLSGNGQ